MYMIVFEIENTLLKTVNKYEIELYKYYKENNMLPNNEIGDFYIYLRPNLKILGDFLNSHNIKYMFWPRYKQKFTEIILEILNPFIENKTYFFWDDYFKFKNYDEFGNPVYFRDLYLLEDVFTRAYPSQETLCYKRSPTGSKFFEYSEFNTSLIKIVDIEIPENNDLNAYIMMSPYTCEKNDNGIYLLCKILHTYSLCNKPNCMYL